MRLLAPALDMRAQAKTWGVAALTLGRATRLCSRRRREKGVPGTVGLIARLRTQYV